MLEGFSVDPRMGTRRRPVGTKGNGPLEPGDDNNSSCSPVLRGGRNRLVSSAQSFVFGPRRLQPSAKRRARGSAYFPVPRLRLEKSNRKACPRPSSPEDQSRVPPMGAEMIFYFTLTSKGAPFSPT